MRRLSIALAGLLLLPLAAKADTFNFSIASSVYSGSGTITSGSANPDGSFLASAISGTGITGLIAANDPDFGNDNLLYPAKSRLFDVNGIAFSSTSGRINLFSTVSGYELQGFDLTGTYFDVNATSFSFSRAAAVTPEPSSLLLAATGMLAIGAAFLSKRSGLRFNA